MSQITATSNSGGEGWLGRLGGGCDYQFASSWVIGAFGDYDFEDMHGTFQDAGLGGGTEKDSATWHVGGRIGYSVTPSLLAFVSGGYTEARFDQVNISVFEVPPTPIGFNIPAHTFHGWFIGGGTEYALSSEIIPINGLFWRTEYRYDRYQSSDIPVLETASGLPSDAGVRIQPNVQTVTTGLVWRFNFGGYGGGYGATRY